MLVDQGLFSVWIVFTKILFIKATKIPSFAAFLVYLMTKFVIDILGFLTIMAKKIFNNQWKLL